MSKEELEQCKSCWDAFVALSKTEEQKNTVKKAEMLVKSLGAMATYTLCGFENMAMPDRVKQIVADGLMYLEVTYKQSAPKN